MEGIDAEDVTVDFDEQTATVHVEGKGVSAEDLVAALEGTRYDARVAD